MIHAEAIALLAPLRAICDCSNSHVAGLGIHEPECTGERATRAVAGLEPSRLCERCHEPIAPDDPGLGKRRNGVTWCGQCWVRYENLAAFGERVRNALHMVETRVWSMDDAQLLSHLHREYASMFRRSEPR